ncbi:TMEM43 family protein [Desulfovibrio sp. OttesenSCG-928-M14]|nr:TMEM43 family protein [Desulfovibrio sp. OttesenSCG-928-M14]
MMAYTETISTSWFSRLGGSFRGIGMGIVLIIAGTILLWWNEGDFVATGDALNEAHAITQELGDISKVDTSKNGQLVHATGPVETKDMLTDPVFGFSINAIRLERKVEFYQWVERSTTEKRKKLGGGEETVTTYTYAQQWTSAPVDSSQFKDPSAPRLKRNFTLANIENFKVQATNVTFGGYRLPDFMISSISGAVPLSATISDEAKATLNDQLVRTAAQARPDSLDRTFSETALDAVIGRDPQESALQRQEREQEMLRRKATEKTEMVHFSGNTVMFGVSPAVPQVGDVRITFQETKPGTVSILAKLNGDTFEQYRASNGKTVSKLSMGTHSLENMYGAAHSSNATMTWILRLVGTILVITGLKFIVAPLEVFASVIPLLGDIVGAGTGIVSTLLGLAWSLLIISIAWLRFRPVVGLGMIAVAVALLALLFFKGRSRKAAKASAPPSPVEPA